jgi:hypothetical protein
MEEYAMKNAAFLILTGFLMSATILAAASAVTAQESARPQQGQPVSQSGLLPLYGVDFNFDPDWVDGTKFPSQAAQYSNAGVSNIFQQVWEELRPIGFNVIRFQLDVRDPSSAANRLANLCVWAKQNGVRLIPVLLATDRGKFPGKDFPQTVSTFINTTLMAMRAGDGQYLPAYGQILAYQIEDQLNHAGLHQPFFPQNVAPMVAQVSTQIRQTEQSALKATEMNASPLLVNVSFDFELVLKQAIAGATMTDEAYAQAYERLKQTLLGIAAIPEIDLIDVQWLAGSLSAGSPEKFAPLIGSLIADVPGKHFIFTTGFSTAFRSGEDQKSFFALAAVNLADYHASAGMDSPFLGVLVRQALKGTDPAPPKAQTASEMAHWNWAAKSSEVVDTWSTKRPSADMSWWLLKVESDLGLVTLQTQGAAGPSILPAAGGETLRQFAGAVSESAAEPVTPDQGQPVSPGAAPAGPDPLPGSTAGAPPTADPATPVPTEPSFKKIAKEKAQQGMATLMDRVIERLGNKLGGAPASSPGAPPTPGADPGATSPGPTPLSVSASTGDVSITPASARPGETVAFGITLHNAGSPDASGLVVAIVDESGSLLGPETQLTDVVVPAGATQTVVLNWTAGDAKTYQPSLRVLDSTLTNQLTSLSLPAVVVTGSPATGAAGIATSGTLRLDSVGRSISLPIGLPQVRGVSIGSGVETVRAGAPSAITVSLSNPYGRPLPNVTATVLVDGRAVASRSLGTLLPKQNRSVLFPDVVFARSGAQQVSVSLESRGARALAGHVTQRVTIGAAAGPAVASRAAVSPAPSQGSSGQGPRPGLRPLLPSLIGGATPTSTRTPASGAAGQRADVTPDPHRAALAGPGAVQSAPAARTPSSPGQKPGTIGSAAGPVGSNTARVTNPKASTGGRDDMKAARPMATATPILGKPDLTVEWVTYPNELPAGSTILLKVRVRNTGTAKAPGTASAREGGYMIDVILSRDSKVPDAPASYSATFREDALLGGGRISGTRDINPKEAQEYAARVAIPADAPKGKISICARVDSLNKIAELDERNNIACWGTTVR